MHMTLNPFGKFPRTPPPLPFLKKNYSGLANAHDCLLWITGLSNNMFLNINDMIKHINDKFTHINYKFSNVNTM